MKKLNKIGNEKIILIVLFFMSFSMGVWSNYRQLWLEERLFTITDISRILSVALICSSIISFIISLFSGKIKIKDIIFESIMFRAISMIVLLYTNDIFVIKTCILLTIMCEVIFSVSYYPLLVYINKTDEMYRKKSLIDYVARDIGIIGCGLLLGISIHNIPILTYQGCLVIALVSNLLSGIALLFFSYKEKVSNEHGTLIKSFKNIFKDKTNVIYLISVLFIDISYGIVFDLMMLILTGKEYINFEVSYASIFIIVCNFLGSVFCSMFNKLSNKISFNMAMFIKFGTRLISFIVAYITNDINAFVISIVISYITSRLLEDKSTGTFLKRVKNEDQFLYGNIRYFIACLGEGIGAFIAGVLIVMSFRNIFLGAAITTTIQIILLLIAFKTIKK